MPEIVPALLVHNLKDFLKRFELVAPHVARVQWDIMDGVFVDNTTFADPAVLDEIDALGFNPPPKIEADLMVADPANWISRLNHPGLDLLIFHFESAPKWEPIFSQARAAGLGVGLAVEPGTPLAKYENLLEKVDRFQAMGGKSGFGGQKFDPKVLETMRRVREKFPNLPISIDIGVNLETAPAMVAAGAEILVTGSAIFDAEDTPNAIESLRNERPLKAT